MWATNYTDPSGEIVPFLAAFLVGGLATAGIGAAFGGVTGAAKSLANAYDNGEQLSLGVIGNALGEGVKGAAVGAAAGFAIGGVLAATAVASPLLAAGAGVGLAGYGLYNTATSAFENFQAGRYASFGVDVVTGLFDVQGLQHGVSQGVSAAKAGKFYNNSTQWDGVAWDLVRGYENQSSGLTRDAMTQIRQNTLGYEHGELMSNGYAAGMGPGAMYRGELASGVIHNGSMIYDVPVHSADTHIHLAEQARVLRESALPGTSITEGNVAAMKLQLSNGITIKQNATSRRAGPLPDKPIPQSNNGNFEPTSHRRGGRKMDTDAEYKLFDYAATELKKMNLDESEYVGDLHLFTEMDMCHSCRDIARDQFNEMFPNITLHVSYKELYLD